MKIRLTFDRTAIEATLVDNATARDFASQLPLTLTFEDYNATEKIAYPPRKLSRPALTGAAAGMGLATAGAFAEAGAAVVLAGFKEDAVRAAAEALAAAGGKALAVRCDVSDDAQVAAMVDRAVGRRARAGRSGENAAR